MEIRAFLISKEIAETAGFSPEFQEQEQMADDR
jgi:hypothetical protein